MRYSFILAFVVFVVISLLELTNSYPRSSLARLRSTFDDDEIEDIVQKPRFFPFNQGGNYQQQQLLPQQLQCTPAIWTCGHHRPPCCHGLTCYQGNAKKGSICITKG
ncbi:unnamed protein product [Didymodactylos carnosus]|uniref:Uncharacterized protein n=1 Tax=Didymodactylos carnosus TaxID=1234261 RepID=A0A813NVR6_9BILA|nr:unnamed protein product [Didymodactylos carnosus]CAF3524004.1 unnamed protein product [Didymodactylos carnosus]